MRSIVVNLYIVDTQSIHRNVKSLVLWQIVPNEKCEDFNPRSLPTFLQWCIERKGMWLLQAATGHRQSLYWGLGRVWPAMVCYGMIHLVPIYRGIIQCGMVYQGVWLIHGMVQFGTVWFVVVGQSMRWFSTGDQQWPYWGWNWPAGGAFTRANPHYSHSSSRPHPTILQLITRHNTFRGGNNRRSCVMYYYFHCNYKVFSKIYLKWKYMCLPKFSVQISGLKMKAEFQRIFKVFEELQPWPSHQACAWVSYSILTYWDNYSHLATRFWDVKQNLWTR